MSVVEREAEPALDDVAECKMASTSSRLCRTPARRRLRRDPSLNLNGVTMI
jgi:hypothetical protein